MTSSKPRALLADDNTSVQAVTSLMLRLLGFEVESAIDGYEAVEAFSRCPRAFDLVVLDADMPRIDGWQAAEQIRALRSEAKIIVISGQGSGLEAARRRRMAFLCKPFGMAELRREIERFGQATS